MTAYNPPLYAFPNVDFNPAIYEQGASYTLSSSNLATNNTWLGTNTFSNVAGIATNVVDAITSTTLSIGTSLANAISIGKSTFMTTILGNLTVNGTTTHVGASSAPTVTYPSNTTDIATTAYVTTAIASGGGSGVSLAGNNTWTGTNNFSNALGVITSYIDRLAVGVLSIGTTVASSITLGSASIPTNIKGALTVGDGANTIALNANSGLNQLLLTGSAGTSGQVLTSGGSGGSLSWGAGGSGVSLAGNNTWTGTNNFSNALGVITSYIDRLAVGVLSIGTTVASSITLGSASIPTNIKGALTVGAGANTIALNANSGLNQLLLTGSAGTSGQYLTTGGSAGSLSWTTGSGGVSLSGTNVWTALNTFSGGLTMGGSNNITLGDGIVKPTSAQLGYYQTTSLVNSYTSIGFFKAQLNSTMTYFSAGITLTPGTYILTYSVQYYTDNATLNYLYFYQTYIVSGATTGSGGLYIGGGATYAFDNTVAKVGFPISSSGDYRPQGSGTLIVSPSVTTNYNVQGYSATPSGTQVGNVIIATNSIFSSARIA